MPDEDMGGNDDEVNNFSGDEGWDDDGGDDGDGWGDEEEDEMDDIVKQALADTQKKKEKKIKEVTITYRPPNYGEMTIARILGDFTDWVPITMHMH